MMKQTNKNSIGSQDLTFYLIGHKWESELRGWDKIKKEDS